MAGCMVNVDSGGDASGCDDVLQHHPSLQLFCVEMVSRDEEFQQPEIQSIVITTGFTS